MDLKTFEVHDSANAGAVMTIINPSSLEPLLDDDGVEMWIRLAGEDSNAYQAVTRSIQNRRLQFAQERGRANITSEELEAEALTRAARCTLAWHIILEGKQPECTEAMAKALYRRFPWLYDQAHRFIHGRANFLPSLNGNSLSMLNGSLSEANSLQSKNE